MIYEYPEITTPIRQGDIFEGIPLVNFSLDRMPLVSDEVISLTTWPAIVQIGEPVEIIVAVKPVTAIVVTQDCDASRSRDITLCEIRRFTDVEKKSANTLTVKSWKSIITQQARLNLKWFYLPIDAQIGFTEKMGVDFMTTIRVSRLELEGSRELRRGRLNPIADEHFRERLGEFFRRYPYDEWYPLDLAEMQSYQTEYQDAIPYPWQQNRTTDTGT